MDRFREIVRNTFEQISLEGFVGDTLGSMRSGYQEIGSQTATNFWIKLAIYLGSAVAILLSIVAFAFGYVIIPAVSTSVAVVCAALFWFRNSIAWTRLLECSRTICSSPCSYFNRHVTPHAGSGYERLDRESIFERSVEVQSGNARVKPEVETEQSKAEQSEAQKYSSDSTSS